MLPKVIWCGMLILCLPVMSWSAAYSLGSHDLVGNTTKLTLQYEDTFAAIAERHGIGFQELVDANPTVDPWLPGEGSVIELPTRYILPPGERNGVLINVAEYRLYYFWNDRVLTYPIGIGRGEFRTPLGTARVVSRLENPSWTPNAISRREHAEAGDILPPVVPPGPDNPLGRYALKLSIPGYFIHGTNKPLGVGQQVSQGCIRLYDEHIATLTELVPKGTPVQMIYRTIKMATRGDEAYVELHRGPYENHGEAALLKLIFSWAQQQGFVLDEAKVRGAVKTRSGIPVRVN